MLITCPHCSSRYDIADKLIGVSGRQVKCSQCRTSFFAAPDGTTRIVAAVKKAKEPQVSDQNNKNAFDEALKSENIALIPADADHVNDTHNITQHIETEQNAWPASDQTSNATIHDPAGAHLSFSALASRPDKAKGNTSPKRVQSLIMKIVSKLLWPLRIVPPTLLAASLLVGLSVSMMTFRAQIVQKFPQTAQVYALMGKPVNLRGIEIEDVRSTIALDQSSRVLVVEGTVRNITGRTVSVPLLALSVQDEAKQALYSWTLEPQHPKIKANEKVTFRARLASPPIEGVHVAVNFTSRDPNSAPISAKDKTEKSDEGSKNSLQDKDIITNSVPNIHIKKQPMTNR